MAMAGRDNNAAKAAYDAFRGQFDSGVPADDLLATERYFAAACEQGDVPPVTLDEADLAVAPDDTRERLLTVYDRLKRLGYDVPSERTADWEKLRPAFKAFQAEARLCPQGQETGELTLVEWRALQEIFNFETPLDVDSWFDGDGVPEPALERAVRLRLSMFGLGSLPERRDWRPKADALGGFAEIARVFGLSDNPPPAALTREFAAVLFGQDALAARLASWTGPVPRAARCRDFLVCVAKVELWLHGFDIPLDDGPALTVQTRRGGVHGRVVEDPSPAAKCISQACEDLFVQPVDRMGGVAAEIPERVPALLRALQQLQASGTTPALPSDSAELIRSLQRQIDASPGLWDRILEIGRTLTAKLFDGVKRAVAWLKRFFDKAISWTQNAFANAWRAVYHFMGSAAIRLRHAMRALADGVGFFVARHVTDQAGRIVYAKRTDSDGRVVVDAVAEPEAVRRFAAALRQRSRAFAVACRIIRLVATSVRVVLGGTVASLGGFVPLLMGLASAYTQVRELDQLLDTYEASAANATVLKYS